MIQGWNRFKTYFRNTYFRADLYRRFFPYLRSYGPATLVIITTEIVLTALSLAEPWTTQIMIDNGFSGQALPSFLLRIFPFLESGGGYRIVLFAVLGGLALKLISTALSFGLEYLKGRVRAGINFRFQMDMFNHFQRLSFTYHDRTTVGDTIYRVSNDAGFVSTMVYSNPRYLFNSLLQLASITWIVVRLDWVIAVLAVAVAPLQYVSIGFYSALFKDRSLRVRSMESKATTILQEVLSCLRVVKVFGQEEREQRRMEEHGWAAVRARLRLETQRSGFSQMLNLASRLDRTLITLISAVRVLSGHITLGEMTVIMAYVGQIHDPITTLGDTLTNIQGSMIDAERALQVLDIDPDIKDAPSAVALDSVHGAVAFERVSFGYPEGAEVLHQVSFTARPGDVVALIGPTGAGKTTIASLLVRFYDPHSGRVTLDGHDLRDLQVKTLRDNMAVVLQEPILFSTTLAENIAYGRPDASMEEIVAAARAANAHEFISALPDGYQTQTGERGVRLSGGERQRISIARAFLKNAPVLILDEPTSSVDSRTELVILEALDRLMAGRTTFIIAHRLTTARRADQILAIEHGRIVESGTHEELVARNGLYAQLYAIQTGRVVGERVELTA